MPGIAGFLSPSASADAVVSLQDSISEDLRASSAWHAASWLDDAVGVGLMAVGRDEPSANRSIASKNQKTLVMEGELFGSPAARSEPAKYMLEGYLRRGAEFFAGLEGRYVAAVWSDPDQTLTLLTDKFGSKPLYYSHLGDSAVFATSIRAVASAPDTPLDLNLGGLIQFFTYGHLWNNDTFFSSIRCLGPATELVIEAGASRARHSRYWRLHKEDGGTSDRDNIDRISCAFKAAVDDQTCETEGLGISLSGGLDARTLLGAIDPEIADPMCVSVGMEGSLDQRSAQRLAKLAGAKYERFTLGEGFLEDFESHLRRMVDLTDGHYLSQCIVMPTFPLYQELGIRVLLRGHVGELLHMHKAYNFSVDRDFQRVGDGVALESWLVPRLQSHLTDGVGEQLLCGVSTAEFNESGRHTLRDALAGTLQWDSPLDRVSQLFLDQRTRRETAMSLVKFNSVVDTRVPYLDSRVVDAVFAASPSLRIGERIQAEMLRRFRPELLAPANSNTGAPVGASPVRKTCSTFGMRLLAKLGVSGYQPYERLGLWLRRELRPLVEAILLDPTCLDRGLLQPDCVRAVVERHSTGQRNHTYLIMAMMIVELGFRRVQGRPLMSPARLNAR